MAKFIVTVNYLAKVIITEADREITIPSSVTKIGYKAFAECTSLTSITIPNSVTEIDDNAFYGCTSLTSIEIPSSVKRIGDLAFWECKNLTSITLPEAFANKTPEELRFMGLDPDKVMITFRNREC